MWLVQEIYYHYAQLYYKNKPFLTSLNYISM